MYAEWQKKLQQIRLEDFLYFLFIVAALLDIFANQKIKQTLFQHSDGTRDTRTLFLSASILIFFVFLGFGVRNYKNLNRLTPGTEEYEIAQVRVTGSLFLLLGQLLLIYYLLRAENVKDSPI